jgi:hypothetical protein
VTQTIKLLLILSQIEGIAKLVKDNEYENYYKSYLSPIFYETHRQLLLTKTQTSTTIKE